MQPSDRLYYTLMKMQLILDGALARYEDEGLRINQYLRKLERKRLNDAFAAIGEALYLVKNEIHQIILHDLDSCFKQD